MLTRVRSAWQALTRGEPLPDPRDGRGFRLIGPTKPYNFNRRKDKQDQLQAYNGWIASAVNRISTDVSELPFGLQRSTGPRPKDFELLDVSQVPDALLRPGRHMDARTFFELSVKHYKSCGEFFWYLITENGIPGGPVIGMQVLYPHWVTEPIYNEDTRQFDRWRVTISGATPREIPMEDVVWVFTPHPLDPWRGASPIEQVALTHDLDLFAKAYGTQLLESGGQPPGILSIDGPVDKSGADVIRERWRESRLDPEMPAVVGKGATYQAIGTTLRDLEWLNLSRMNRDQILAIYGTPAAKLGLVEDVNRNTSDAMDLTYNRDVIKPMAGAIRSGINRVLPRFGVTDPRITWWFENPVQDDKEFELNKANDAVGAGVITVNEYLVETGREDIGSPGEVYMVPNTHRIVSNLEPDPVVAPVTPPAERSTSVINVVHPPEQALLEDQVDDIDGTILSEHNRLELPSSLVPQDLDGLSGPQVISTLQARGLLPFEMPISESQFRQAAASFENRQGRLEREMRAAMRKLFSAEQKQVVRQITERNRLPEIRVRTMAYDLPMDWWERSEFGEQSGDLKIWRDIHFPLEGEIEETLQRDLLDTVFSQQRLSWIRQIRKMIADGQREGWALLAEQVDRRLVDFQAVRDQVQTQAQKEAERRVEQLRSTTRRLLAVGLAAYIAARRADGLDVTNEGVAREAARIYDNWKGARVDTISRTETSKAVNGGSARHQREAKRRLGLQFQNTWNAVFVNTRDAHAVAHGQRRGFGEAFAVGGEELRFPLDPRGRADNVINCQCSLIARIVEPREERTSHTPEARRRRRRRKRKDD